MFVPKITLKNNEKDNEIIAIEYIEKVQGASPQLHIYYKNDNVTKGIFFDYDTPFDIIKDYIFKVAIENKMFTVVFDCPYSWITNPLYGNIKNVFHINHLHFLGLHIKNMKYVKGYYESAGESAINYNMIAAEPYNAELSPEGRKSPENV